LTGTLFGRWGYLMVSFDISPALNFVVADGRGWGIAVSISVKTNYFYFWDTSINGNATLRCIY
jgi:hypothetical protein